MKRTGVLSLMLVVVLAILSLSAVRDADAQLMVHKPVKWREIGILTPRDTTFMTDEADTIRTAWIDTKDWDWGTLLRQGSVATGWPAASVTFYSANSVNNGVTDTLTFTVERGVKGPAATDTVIAVGSYTMIGSLGSIAACPLPASPNVNAWWGPLICDPDSRTDANVWGAQYLRLRVAGDQSGTTPKISQLKCVISYLQRAGAN